MKIKPLFLLLLLAITVPLAFFISGTASAAAAFPIAGRNEFQGYFSGRTKPRATSGYTGSNVMYSGIYGVNNKADFINFIESRLNDPDIQVKTGARFILQTMRGADPATGQYDYNFNITAADIQDWEDRVNNPAINMNPDYVAFPYTANSLYLGTYSPPLIQDDAFFPDDDSADSIVFTNAAGVVLYAIRIECANPVVEDSLYGLPQPVPPPPPVTLSCGDVKTNPSNAEAGQPLTIMATVTASGGPPQTPTAATMAVQGQSGSTQNLEFDPAVTGNTITLTSKNYKPPSADKYTVTWTVTVPGASPSTLSCGGDFQSYSSFDALAYPFFSAENGDVVAGASFAAASGTSAVPCATHNQKAGISSWNNSGSPDYSGAGSQYAAMAMNYIQGFISNKGSGPPTSLSFSNVGKDIGSGNSITGAQLFGGLFGSVASCVDYWSTKPQLSTLAAPTSGDVGTLTSNNPYAVQNGTYSITGGSISDGRHVTIYVNGDVYIARDITYASTNWNSTAEIPSFKLIVHGSIFISPNVHNLDGIYVAVPDSPYDPAVGAAANNLIKPNPGTISTCADSGTPPFTSFDPAQIADNHMDTVCRSQLTVTGAFIANQLFLLRTYGTRSDNSSPAELFQLSPEVWLSQSDQSRSIDIDSYQSYISLPPVL